MEQLVLQAAQVHLECRVQLVLLVSQVLRASRACRVIKASRAYRASRELRVTQATLEQPELLAYWDLKVNRAKLVMPELQEHVAELELQEVPVKQVRWDHLEALVCLDLQVKLDLRDSEASQDWLVLLDSRELRVSRDRPVPRGHLDKLERLDKLDLKDQ